MKRLVLSAAWNNFESIITAIPSPNNDNSKNRPLEKDTDVESLAEIIKFLLPINPSRVMKKLLNVRNKEGDSILSAAVRLENHAIAERLFLYPDWFIQAEVNQKLNDSHIGPFIQKIIQQYKTYYTNHPAYSIPSCSNRTSECALFESIDKGLLFYRIVKNLYVRNHANAELDIRYLLSLPGHRMLFEASSEYAPEADADFIAKVLAYEQYKEPQNVTRKPIEVARSELQSNDSNNPSILKSTKPIPTDLYVDIEYNEKSNVAPVAMRFTDIPDAFSNSPKVEKYDPLKLTFEEFLPNFWHGCSRYFFSIEDDKICLLTWARTLVKFEFDESDQDHYKCYHYNFTEGTWEYNWLGLLPEEENKRFFSMVTTQFNLDPTFIAACKKAQKEEVPQDNNNPDPLKVKIEKEPELVKEEPEKKDQPIAEPAHQELKVKSDEKDYQAIVEQLIQLVTEYKKNSSSKKASQFYDEMMAELNPKSDTLSFENRVRNFYLYFTKQTKREEGLVVSNLVYMKQMDTSRSMLRFFSGIVAVLAIVLTFPVSLPLTSIISVKTGRNPLDLFNTHVEQFSKEIELLQRKKLGLNFLCATVNQRSSEDDNSKLAPENYPKVS